MAKRKVRLSISDPKSLLEELVRARTALKRTRGAAGSNECPNMDGMIVLLHQAEELLVLTNSPATPPIAAQQ